MKLRKYKLMLIVLGMSLLTLYTGCSWLQNLSGQHQTFDVGLKSGKQVMVNLPEGFPDMSNVLPNIQVCPWWVDAECWPYICVYHYTEENKQTKACNPKGSFGVSFWTYKEEIFAFVLHKYTTTDIGHECYLYAKGIAIKASSDDLETMIRKYMSMEIL